MDELTVFELLDPVEDPRDVRSMMLYLKIDPVKEWHLLWVAKLAVVEPLPPEFEEITVSAPPPAALAPGRRAPPTACTSSRTRHLWRCPYRAPPENALVFCRRAAPSLARPDA